ncbi:MAG: hypothetical protein V3V28_04980 [Polaribacter sp.]|uniref:hypothetical protein n=1 Tax=Polaribacter sp. TaxID=1920175 RepID=UPI002F35528E
MKIKLFFKRLLQLGFIILIGFIIYSNLRLNGTWVISNQKWQEPISIISFEVFKKNEYFSLYSYEDRKDEFNIAFGDVIYNKNDKFYSKNVIAVKHINKDNLVLNLDYGDEYKTHLKIPDSLKYSGKIDFFYKFLEFRLNYNKQTCCAL